MGNRGQHKPQQWLGVVLSAPSRGASAKLKWSSRPKLVSFFIITHSLPFNIRLNINSNIQHSLTIYNHGPWPWFILSLSTLGVSSLAARLAIYDGGDDFCHHVQHPLRQPHQRSRQQSRLRSGIRQPIFLALSVPRRCVALFSYSFGLSATAYPYKYSFDNPRGRPDGAPPKGGKSNSTASGPTRCSVFGRFRMC
jgi:hypothetical protein